MNSLNVNLNDRSYPIYFADSFDQLNEVIKPVVDQRVCAVVSNPVVFPLYGQQVVEQIKKAGGIPVVILIPDGEEHKSIARFKLVLEEFVEKNLNRSSVVIALGGGVVGDLAGYVAASYMRGIPFLQIPTTLLAQVDSSVGGKTGLNLDHGKNLVGAFYQPKLVFVNWNTLLTLDARQFKAGYAEVIKYGVIADEELFSFLENETKAIFADLENKVISPKLGELIKACCKIKAEVVAQDEREGGIRAILNYGHTFGHAVENLTSYTRFVHGEAVAIGMQVAAVLAFKMGLCPQDLIDRQKQLLLDTGLPIVFPDLDLDLVLQAFYHDKKATNNTTKFILPTKIGAVKLIENPDPELLVESIKFCQ